jgi:hypothetical protein
MNGGYLAKLVLKFSVAIVVLCIKLISELKIIKFGRNGKGILGQHRRQEESSSSARKKEMIEEAKNPDNILLIPISDGIRVSVNGVCVLKRMTAVGMLWLAIDLLVVYVRSLGNVDTIKQPK